MSTPTRRALSGMTTFERAAFTTHTWLYLINGIHVCEVCRCSEQEGRRFSCTTQKASDDRNHPHPPPEGHRQARQVSALRVWRAPRSVARRYAKKPKRVARPTRKGQQSMNTPPAFAPLPQIADPIQPGHVVTHSAGSRLWTVKELVTVHGYPYARVQGHGSNATLLLPIERLTRVGRAA